MFIFVKMSGGWFCKEYTDVNDAKSDLQSHVDNGDIVALADDVEYFADQMKINVDDIQKA